jgi:hypothetical protein
MPGAEVDVGYPDRTITFWTRDLRFRIRVHKSSVA